MQNTPGLNLRDDTLHHHPQLIDDTIIVFNNLGHFQPRLTLGRGQ